MTRGNDNGQSDLKTGKCLWNRKSVTIENYNGQSDKWSAYESGRDFKASLSSYLSSFKYWDTVKQNMYSWIPKHCDGQIRFIYRLRRWYITIPSSDQWCTTIENQWLSYPKTIGKTLIPMVALNHSIQWWWKLWKPLKVSDGSKIVCWKSNKHNNQL